MSDDDFPFELTALGIHVDAGETPTEHWNRVILQLDQIEALFTGVPDGENVWKALKRIADLRNYAHQCLNEELTREHS